MTALVVLENSRPDDVVTVSTAASQEKGKLLGLHKGDRFTVADLLAATLMQSANDASRALADHVGKSESQFVAMMNRRAAKLGLRDTHFANASGHDHPQLYSTANDLSLLAKTFFAHPFPAKLGRTVKMSITSSDNKRTFTFENKNELLGRYRGIVNGKTGTTNKAGKCLIAVAERDGTRVMLVLLGARERWWNAEKMLDQAFASTKKRITARP
jgi:D-alanyl-D-alanine carboxypeptidase (penicillin-binding protein 5/6)